MLLNEAFNAGKKIKKVLSSRENTIKLVCDRLRNVRSDKHKLSYEYLDICLEYGIFNDNKFIIQMLNSTFSSEDVTASLILGILNEDTEFITFSKATKLYNLNSSTLRNRRKRGGFKEYEIEKRGRDWWVSKKALERIYGICKEL